jgi:hypothetical protein
LAAQRGDRRRFDRLGDRVGLGGAALQATDIVVAGAPFRRGSPRLRKLSVQRTELLLGDQFAARTDDLVLLLEILHALRAARQTFPQLRQTRLQRAAGALACFGSRVEFPFQIDGRDGVGQQPAGNGLRHSEYQFYQDTPGEAVVRLVPLTGGTDFSSYRALLNRKLAGERTWWSRSSTALP